MGAWGEGSLEALANDPMYTVTRLALAADGCFRLPTLPQHGAASEGQTRSQHRRTPRR
jgi:hypothetical protein